MDQILYISGSINNKEGFFRFDTTKTEHHIAPYKELL